MHRAKDASSRAQEVRHDVDGGGRTGQRAQRLRRLGDVLVVEHPVRHHVVIQVREVLQRRGLLACARRSSERVDEHLAFKHEAVGEDRRQPDDHARREAAGVAHDRRICHTVPEQLGHPVHRATQERLRAVTGIGDRGVRRRVLRIRLRGWEAKVARVVDEAHASAHERSGMAHRDAVRGGEDHNVAVRAHARRVGSLHHQLAAGGEMRVHLVDAPAGVVARDQRGDLELGVAQQQLEDAEPAVSRRADDLCSVHRVPHSHAGHIPRLPHWGRG